MFVREHHAATRRLSADVDAAAARLRPVYVGRAGPASASGPGGLHRPARRRRRRRGGRRGRRTRVAAQRRPRLRHPLAAAVALVPGAPRPRRRQRRARPDRTAGGGADGPAARRARRPRRRRGGGARTARAVGAGRAGGGGARRAGPARGAGRTGRGRPRPAAGGRPLRPAWWPVAVVVQASMTLLQVFGALWLTGQIAGVLEPGLVPPVLVMLAGIVGGPLVEWACVVAARARRAGTGRRPNGGCARRPRAAAGPWCSTRSRRS